MWFGQTVDLLVTGFQTAILPGTIHDLLILSPIALAFLFGAIFWKLWVSYVRSAQFLKLKYTVVEIRLPRDLFKSPLAMEAFLHSIHNTADGSLWAQYWNGETRPWYSLELISIEGQVKFMAWLEDRRKASFMTALYGQFPGIEVHECEDYAKSVHFDPEKMRIYAAEFKFTNKNQGYPIKTYVDYGLEKDPKEEFKVDPLVPVLEYLGSVRPNQQVWFQFLIRAHKPEQRKPGHLFKKYDAWKEAAQDEINKILIRNPKTKVAGEINPETGYGKLPTISKNEQDIVEALGRSITKLPFDVGIRALYISPKKTFDTPFGIGGIISSMKQFNTEHLNGFKPNGDKWHNKLGGDPWEDFQNMRRNRYARLALKAYKRRSYFYTPFEATPLVLNTEELATIYHFPGAVAATPTLARVPSKKAEAPANLPV